MARRRGLQAEPGWSCSRFPLLTNARVPLTFMAQCMKRDYGWWVSEKISLPLHSRYTEKDTEKGERRQEVRTHPQNQQRWELGELFPIRDRGATLRLGGWEASILTQYWGGGHKTLFLLILNNIGGHVPPAPPPPPPPTPRSLPIR